MSKKKTPQPVAVTTICSECGLDWDLHGDEPTTDDCIRLLKAELAKQPETKVIPMPYPVYPERYWPYARPYYDRRPYLEESAWKGPITITCNEENQMGALVKAAPREGMGSYSLSTPTITSRLVSSVS